MKKITITVIAATFVFLLSGCGAHVSTTTGPNGTVINRPTVWSGTTLTYNPQTGFLYIDATGKASCSDTVGMESLP